MGEGFISWESKFSKKLNFFGRFTILHEPMTDKGAIISKVDKNSKWPNF